MSDNARYSPPSIRFEYISAVGTSLYGTRLQREPPVAALVLKPNARDVPPVVPSSELLHGAESPDSAGGISASALSALSTGSTQQSTDSRVSWREHALWDADGLNCCYNRPYVFGATDPASHTSRRTAVHSVIVVIRRR